MSANVAAKGAASLAGNGMKVVLVLTRVLRAAFSESLSLVLAFIGYLQMVCFLPAVEVDFPPNALTVIEELVKLASFELLPTEDIFPYFLNPGKDGDSGLTHKYFKICSFFSK